MLALSRRIESGPNLRAANPSNAGFPPAVGGACDRPEASIRRPVLSMVPSLPRIFWRKVTVAQERADNGSAGSRPDMIGPLASAARDIRTGPPYSSGSVLRLGGASLQRWHSVPEGRRQRCRLALLRPDSHALLLVETRHRVFPLAGSMPMDGRTSARREPYFWISMLLGLGPIWIVAGLIVFFRW